MTRFWVTIISGMTIGIAAATVVFVVILDGGANWPSFLPDGRERGDHLSDSGATTGWPDVLIDSAFVDTWDVMMDGASAHLAHNTYHHDCSIRMIHGEGGIRDDTNTITLNCLDNYGMAVVDSEHGQTYDRSTIPNFELTTNPFENCRYSINSYNHTETGLTMRNFLVSISCSEMIQMDE